jgi:hypothetical protein
MESHCQGKGCGLRETGHPPARNVESCGLPVCAPACSATRSAPSEAHDYHRSIHRRDRAHRVFVASIRPVANDSSPDRVCSLNHIVFDTVSCAHVPRRSFRRLYTGMTTPTTITNNQTRHDPTRPDSPASRRCRSGRNDPRDQPIIRLPTHLERTTRPAAHRPKRPLLDRPTRTIRRRPHFRKPSVALTLPALRARCTTLIGSR